MVRVLARTGRLTASVLAARTATTSVVRLYKTNTLVRCFTSSPTRTALPTGPLKSFTISNNAAFSGTLAFPAASPMERPADPSRTNRTPSRMPRTTSSGRFAPAKQPSAIARRAFFAVYTAAYVLLGALLAVPDHFFSGIVRRVTKDPVNSDGKRSVYGKRNRRGP